MKLFNFFKRRPERWLCVARLGGVVRTSSDEVFVVERAAFVDYCPETDEFRIRRKKGSDENVQRSK